MALSDYISGGQLGTTAPIRRIGSDQVMGTLERFVGSNSPYMQNARRRGLETAATRGGINSSIAAGAAERAALEAAQPLVDQSLQIDQTGANAEYDDWLATQNFNRALQGQRFSSSLNMLSAIQQYGLEDPELYSPEVLSGFSNFFEKNVNDTLKRYFGG